MAPEQDASPGTTAEELSREFFAAIDARDPRRLRATLANHAAFRALPHRDVIRPADEIVAYFGTVVSSYPTARWEVTDVISDGERAAVQEDTPVGPAKGAQWVHGVRT